jgi:hypothetical protein
MLARREAAAALQADAEVLLLRAGMRAVLGAQRVRLAALPLQVYPVHYAAFPACARTPCRSQPCPCWCRQGLLATEYADHVTRARHSQPAWPVK